jgi:hypothetical protein
MDLLSNKTILRSHGFIAGLFLLLLNDLFLKDHFHNFLTGKISDLAGLFILPLFLLIWFPNKKYLYVIIGIGFIFWKSEFSQPLINCWNSLFFLPCIHRTVDFTDNFCLIVLPLSWFYSQHYNFIQYKTISKLIFPLAIFSFFSTSIREPVIENINNDYFFKCKADAFREILTTADHQGLRYESLSNGEFDIYYSITEFDSITILTVNSYQLHYSPLIDDFEIKKLDEITRNNFINSLNLKLPPNSSFEYTGLVKLKNDSIDKEYSLLKGIPNGSYKEIQDSISIKGFYKNGFKDSIWSFYKKDQSLERSITYNKGEKIKDQPTADQASYYNTREMLLLKSKIGLAVDCIILVLIIIFYIIYSNKNSLFNSSDLSFSFLNFLGLVSGIFIPVIAFFLWFALRDNLPDTDYYMGVSPEIIIIPLTTIFLCLINPALFAILFLSGKLNFLKNYGLLFILFINLMITIIVEHLRYIQKISF